MNKQELIALTEELLKEENLDNRTADLQYLRRQYKFYAGRDEDTFAEQEETDRFVALFNELAKREPKLLSSPYEEKKNIIAAARKLLDKKEILAANRELDRLSDEFKKVGRCSTKEQDDELWGEFRQVKDEFYAKKQAFFEELDKSNACFHNKLLLSLLFLCCTRSPSCPIEYVWCRFPPSCSIKYIRCCRSPSCTIKYIYSSSC